MAPPAAGGGNVLTKKYGPLPGWAWGAIGAGGLLVYRWYRARQASSGAASSTPSSTGAFSPQAVPTASLTTPGGFSYSGPLSGLQSVIPQGAMAQTASGNAPPSTQFFQLNPSQATSLANAGQPEYFQLGGMTGSQFPYYNYIPGGQPNATFASGQPQGGYALYTQGTPGQVAA